MRPSRERSIKSRNFGTHLILYIVLLMCKLSAPLRDFFPVQFVIFDLDGVIVDTEPLYTEAYSEMCSKYGKTYTHDIRMKVLGTQQEDSYNTIIRECELPLTAADFGKMVDSILQNKFQNIRLMPGAERLISHLARNQVFLAIATSSQPHLYELKTRNYPDLFSKFHHVVIGSSDPEVKNGKPAPDIYEVCRSRFPHNPPASMNLVFEDSPNGVESAIAAGMQVVMIADDTIEPKYKARATSVVSSLEEFLPEEYHLPPFGFEPEHWLWANHSEDFLKTNHTLF